MAVAYGVAKLGERRPTLVNYTGTESVNITQLPTDSATAFPLIELHVSARSLKDMDVITVSDPICVLFAPSGGRSRDPWTEVSRTEVVWNNLNPEWVTYFKVMYVFEIRQPLLFRVYDVDSAAAQLSAHDFVGEAQVELSQIVAHPAATELTLSLPGRRENRGTLIIAHEQVEHSSSLVNFNFVGRSLKKSKILFRNDPFFVVAKAAEAGQFLPVYKSEVSQSLRWKPFSVSYQSLCNNDPERPIRITFFDYRSHSAAVPIGHCDMNFSRMCETLGQAVTVVDTSRRTVGEFILADVSLVHKFTFYDFVRGGGIQLNLHVAIDFTGSNLDQDDPNSLHFVAPNGDSMNMYERCIRAVGEILCPYDSDQLFPVVGFGAKIFGTSVVSHCFPLTLSAEVPFVRGLDGILGAYRYALQHLLFSGPTRFAEIIRDASRKAVDSFRESRAYTIMLIVTDGCINDMQDTIDAIVAAGRLPLSIIIVGVGNEDFDAMDVLDADDVPLVDRAGHKMCRDLVQFVPFNEFADKHYSALATAVLEEIPRQLCEWAEMNGVYPQSAS
jgi:vacuolar-type H+-ATPase subunit F/Vma7